MIQKLNTKPNEVPKILEGCTDTRWTNNTIYNHFENPIDFMDTIIANKELANQEGKFYIEEGIKAYKKLDEKDSNYDKLYDDVAKKVKSKLIARGFKTSLLYGNVEFSTENTGMMSKTRAMLGRRDCYFKNSTYDDSKLFHDIYINLSYSWEVSNSTIRNNSYALFALVSALSKVIGMRVYVVNHVSGKPSNTCYSYNLKKFRMPIKPKEFLFFTSNSKRTFGWASYEMISDAEAMVGNPKNTVSIADFNLDKEIDEILTKVKRRKPRLLK